MSLLLIGYGHTRSPANSQQVAAAFGVVVLLLANPMLVDLLLPIISDFVWKVFVLYSLAQMPASEGLCRAAVLRIRSLLISDRIWEQRGSPVLAVRATPYRLNSCEILICALGHLYVDSRLSRAGRCFTFNCHCRGLRAW